MIQRYDSYAQGIGKDPEGGYVAFEDYEKLEQELAEAAKLLGLEKEWTENNAGVITQFSKVLEERNKELTDLKERYRWRDVSEELPEPYEYMPCLNNLNKPLCAYWNPKEKFFYGFSRLL